MERSTLKRTISLLMAIFFILQFKPQVVHALTMGDYEYTISGNNATITKYSGAGGNITIPSTINDGVFEYTVTSIGEGAFWNSYNIYSVTLPDSITSIGNYAFFYCINLRNINIPSSVTYLGKSSFVNCYNLTNITIPNSVTKIEDSLFEGCTSLTNITIPDSVTSIGDSAFYLCYNIANIIIPDSVTSIGKDAFAGCGSLKSVVVPDSVITIGDDAFGSCVRLTSITVGASVTNIGVRAFSSASLETIDVHPLNKYYSSIDGILYNKLLNKIISFPGGKGISFNIPDSVTSIGDSAFYFSCLQNINIPSSVTSIGESAFEGCGNLSKVTIPTSVNFIGSKAFRSCGNLVNIDVDPLNEYYSSIDGVLLNKIENILIAYPAGKGETYSIPNNITNISSDAFSHSNLASITIPDSVITIGDNAFEGCWNLKSVTFGNSIKSISKGMFRRCNNLSSIIIPNSVINISDFAFQECYNLTSIIIPSNVTTIGNNAFSYCNKLSEVQFLGNSPTIGENVFEGSNSNFMIYYNCSKKGFTNPWYGYKTTKIGIEVTTHPIKTTYIVGEGLDLTGLVVTGYYKDGTTGIIPNSMLSVSGFDSSKPISGQIITLKVSDKTCNYTVDIVPKTHTVTFNSNGGTSISTLTVIDNTYLSSPTPPTKTGYVFGGWYKDADCKTVWNFATDKVTTDITLYAKWLIKRDVNQDGEVDILDLAEVSKHYNKSSGQSNWNSLYDFNKDNIIDIYDLVLVARTFTK